MIQLPPKTISNYRCEYCNHLYHNAKWCAAHEAKCYRNPERHCPNCHDTGWEETVTWLNWKRGTDPEKIHCRVCVIAAAYGGRSFIHE